MGFPGGSAVKNPPANAGDMGSIIPEMGRFLWRRAWQPTPVFLPGKSHRQRRLAGYSPWGHKRVRLNLVTKQQHQQQQPKHQWREEPWDEQGWFLLLHSFGPPLIFVAICKHLWSAPAHFFNASLMIVPWLFLFFLLLFLSGCDEACGESDFQWKKQ